MSTQTNQKPTPNLFKAMAGAFKEIGGALKNGENPHYKSRYADFSSVLAAVQPALANHDLFLTQPTIEREGYAAVETIIGHVSGEKMSCGITAVPMSKHDGHGYGSSLTYARRYGLASALGVAPEDVGGDKDDDCNAGCGKGEKKEKAPAKAMAPDEIKSFAARVVTSLEPLLEKTPESYATVERYLSYCQASRPGENVRERIEKAVVQNPSEFLGSMTSWYRKQPAGR